MIYHSFFIKVILSIITSFLVTYLFIPTIVRMARYKNLFDYIDNRKIHKAQIPRLGGIAIYAGFSVAFYLFMNFCKFYDANGFLAALLIIFFVGMKDDILVISPLTKFIGQIIAATIVVLWGGALITNLHGFFGIYEIPYVVGYFLAVLVILITINAFNFIDGVDGLSASIGIISSVAFGIWFYLTGFFQYFFISFIFAASLLAFLRFNMFPSKNKIFMGDTGSMLIGFMLAFLGIKFNQLDLLVKDSKYFIYPAPAVALGFMLIPYFDFFRVILIRLVQKKSIFQADNNHLHHLLLKLGLKHQQITLLLSFFSLFFSVLTVFIASFMSIRRMILVLLLIALIFSIIPEILLNKKKK